MSFEAELLERARSLGLAQADRVAAAGHGEEAARLALKHLAEAELLGFTVRADRGGNATQGLCADDDVSVRALVVLRDELAYHNGLLDLMFVMQGLGSYPLQRGGSEALCAEVLPRVIDGSHVCGYCLTEPGAGSSLDEIATRATKDGAGYRLSGRKIFISNAPIADGFTVLARTSGEPGDRVPGGLSMFYVPGDAEGLRAEGFEVMAPHPIGEVHFDGVFVPEAARLGAEGEGLDIALATLARFRTSVAAAANGFARRALDESRRHLSERHQFGRPLGANQGLRWDLAEMDARLRGAQLLVREAAERSDTGHPDTAASVARAKLTATENASYVCDRAVQHFGGLGVKRGVLVEQLYREVRSLRIYEGASEVQKLILGKLALGREAAEGPL